MTIACNAGAVQRGDAEGRAENADSDWEESGFPERAIARGGRGITARVCLRRRSYVTTCADRKMAKTRWRRPRKWGPLADFILREESAMISIWKEVGECLPQWLARGRRDGGRDDLLRRQARAVIPLPPRAIALLGKPDSSQSLSAFSARPSAAPRCTAPAFTRNGHGLLIAGVSALASPH